MRRDIDPPNLEGCEGVTGESGAEIIVWIDPNGRDVVNTIIHESVHVFQKFCAYIAETNPGSEFQAYTVAHISCTFLTEFKRIEDALHDKWKT